MKKHSPGNERIKHKYFAFLEEAKRRSGPTVGVFAKALNRFEVYSKYRDSSHFTFSGLFAFRNHLSDQNSKMSGKKLSKTTLHRTLTQLKHIEVVG